jgi:hypothetical protein
MVNLISVEAYFDPGAGGWSDPVLASVRRALDAHIDYLCSKSRSPSERAGKRLRDAELAGLSDDGRRVLCLILASLEHISSR